MIENEPVDVGILQKRRGENNKIDGESPEEPDEFWDTAHAEKKIENIIWVEFEGTRESIDSLYPNKQLIEEKQGTEKKYQQFFSFNKLKFYQTSFCVVYIFFHLPYVKAVRLFGRPNHKLFIRVPIQIHYFWPMPLVLEYSVILFFLITRQVPHVHFPIVAACCKQIYTERVPLSLYNTSFAFEIFKGPG